MGMQEARQCQEASPAEHQDCNIHGKLPSSAAEAPSASVARDQHARCPWPRKCLVHMVSCASSKSDGAVMQSQEDDLVSSGVLFEAPGSES